MSNRIASRELSVMRSPCPGPAMVNRCGSPATQPGGCHDRPMGIGRSDVIVVGAGLAGLRCAVLLSRAGLDVAVVEASDAIGGRVRTDRVDGFLLDRGFQVFNDAYPEVRAAVDLGRLDLCRMDDAVVVHRGGRLHRLANPLAHPSDVVGLARTPLLGW